MKNKAETAFLSLSLLEQFPEVQSNRLNFKFPGRGQKAVEVAPLAEALEFAFLLPGRNAAKVRKEAAKLLVRYFGGDLSLVDEIFQRNCVQAALAQIPEEERTAEQQTARLFGGSVESTTAQPTLAPALSIFLLLFDAQYKHLSYTSYPDKSREISSTPGRRPLRPRLPTRRTWNGSTTSLRGVSSWSCRTQPS